MRCLLRVARLSALFSVVLRAVVRGNSTGTSWYLGCCDGNSLLSGGQFETLAGQTPDPLICSKQCLDRGFQIMGVSNETCYCTNKTDAVLVRQSSNSSELIEMSAKLSNGKNDTGCSVYSNKLCMNASLPDRDIKTTHIPATVSCLSRFSGSACLPHGADKSSFAVYSTLGPYIYNVSIMVVAERVQIGKPFILEVSGYLATALRKPVGIPNLSPDTISQLQLVISWMPHVRRTHTVSVSDNGFFTIATIWTYAEPGIYHINATVTNVLSVESGNVCVTALIPEPTALEVTAVQRPEDIPSCVPFSVGHAESLEKVFLGSTSTFKAFVAMGVNMEFSWHFTDNSHTHQSAGDCNDCLTSTVNHTFEKQGTYKIIVNASNIYNWIQKAISVAVVPQTLSTLTFSSRSGYLVELGHNVTLEVEFFTTVRQFLFLNATFQTGVTHTHQLGDHSPAFSTLGHMQLAESYGLHNCLLHVQMIHCYSTVGNFNVSLAVFSQTAAEHASLPQFIQVYEPIRNVLPSLQWEAVIPTGVNSTLTVIAPKDRSGSAVIWNITKGNLTVLNRTTWDWSLTLSLQDEGHYRLWVTAFNPISSASFSTELVAQDVISGLSVSCPYPKYIKSGTTITINATVATGSNVSYYWSLGTNSTLVTDSGTAMHLYSQAGVNIVTVKAENSVSCILSKALEFIVQDPVGDFVLRIPSIVTVNHTTVFSFAVMSGTNMSVAVFSNQTLVYNDSSYMTGNSVLLNFTFSEVGPVHIVVRATNHVFSSNSTVGALVVKEIDMVTLELPQQPVVGESIMLIAHVNGYLWTHSNYLYNWTLPQNQTFCTGSPIISFTSHYPGPLLVSVMVTNFASSASAELRLSVSEMSTSPSVLHRSAIAVGTQAQFLLKNFYSGDLLDVDFGNGNTTTVAYFAEEKNSINHTYSLAGFYRIRVTSDRGPLLSSLIEVQDPVESLQLTGPDTFSLTSSNHVPSLLTWTANVSRGTNYIYKWTFSKGKHKGVVIGSNKFFMEVSEPAQLSIEVTVENEVSQLSRNVSTSIQFPIADVSLTATRAALGQSTDVALTVVPAQGYVLSLNFGDGESLLSSSLEQPPSWINCSSAPLCSSTFSFSHTFSSTGVYNLSATVSNTLSSVTKSAEAAVEEPITCIQMALTSPTVIKIHDFINASASVHSGSEITFQWQISSPISGTYSAVDRNTGISSVSYKPSLPDDYIVSVRVSSPLYSSPFMRTLSSPVKVRGPVEAINVDLPFGVNYAKLTPQPNGAYATEALVFRVHNVSEEVSFKFDFGDGSPLSCNKGNTGFGAATSCYHQFTKEGTFFITVTTYNEFFNATKELGPYYVEIMPENLTLTMDSSVVNKNEVIVFKALLIRGTNVTYTWNMGDQTTYVDKGPKVSHRFLTAATYSVSVSVQNRVGSVSASTSVSVLHRMQPVFIHTDETVFATNTNITFIAMTAEPDPLEFLWHFGDKPPKKTTSRNILKIYYSPGRYNVIVNASNRFSSFTSDIYPITIQRKVQPNRLLSNASVLLNANVTFQCWINAGTNVTYQWDFGDGNKRIGESSESHVFSRLGEFTVEVTVFNLVSSVSLTRQIFVVHEPCQPPPVKNMGPLKIQVRRYQTLHLGVTFEADIQCNISQGLLYQWVFYDSNGFQAQLPQIEVNQQAIELPNNLLHYGTYTAIARVQIKGSVVYSNYTVRIQVVPTPPVAVISGGSNIFISNRNGSFLTLNGQGSYDLDFPGNPMRFKWDCKPLSRIETSCFDVSIPTSIPVVVLPASILKDRFDQFKFTLTVQSRDRSSTSEMFVTIEQNLPRKILVFCYHCRGNTANWNEQFSVRALCENFSDIENITFTWNLYLVNASSKVVFEVPFCKSLDVSVPARILAYPVNGIPPSTAQTPRASSNTWHPSAPTSSSPIAPSKASSPVPVASSTHITSPVTNTTTTVTSAAHSYTSVLPHVPRHSQNTTGKKSDIISRNISFTGTTVPPSTVEYAFPVPTTPFPSEFPLFPLPFPEESPHSGGRPRRSPEAPEQMSTIATPPNITPDFTTVASDFSIKEGDISGEFPPIFEGDSAGRRPGLRDGSYTGGDTEDTEADDKEGYNIVGPGPQAAPLTTKTLLDLDRRLIDSAVFQSYTLAGISSDIISFMPFTLKANNLYMLEVSASSQHNLWGKTQFFFSTNEVPQGMTCQVQPSKGYEIRTDFSVFCTSGKEDLLYVYSFSTANSSRKTLYRGRDFQYFFNLPSGEPADNYKVTIYIEIHNRFGSATQPCPVNVTVLPSFLRSNSSAYSPEQELYVDGLRNLTTLMHMGNSVTTRNYVTLLTSVLNRLALDPAASKELQTQTRSALISAVCELSVNKRALMLDNISMLKALMRVTSQVTFDSAKLVTGHVQKLAAQFSRPDTAAIYVLDEWTVSSLLSLLSNALEARLPASEEGIQLTLQGIRASSDLLLSYVLMNNVTEYSVSTSLMALKISRQCRFQGAVSSSGSTTFYLPPTLGQHSSRHSSSSSTDRTCFISRLMFFRRDPYFWATAPVKINGDIADLTLFNCTTKKEIKAHALSTPVTVEFDKRWGNESGSPQFYLLRNEINIHQFSIKPENLQEALQISVDFIRPDNHTFPIMLLFRMFEKPTPSSYNVKKIHRWEGNTVHIFMSSSSLKDPGNYYLALLNANYNRAPSNKYITHAVNYTLRIEGTRCLYWDGIKDWKSDGCVPLQGLSSSKVNCSCNHLRTFTVAYQEIRSEYNCTDVSQFISAFDNLVLCSVILISLGACSLLAVVCKRADMANEKKGSLVLLQDNSPSDQQMYTVTIDTGFRSRSIMTAKVHIVLYGEEGVSETRELNCSEKVLFERNSRHTFILSSFDSLGPIWKVHLWHNNAGHSPSWYVSHVIVKDLGTGTSWFFPAECWLAVDEGDGKVERELTSLTQGPGFKKLLYIKLTEYLEDFHSWASVYSRPSHSRFTHTQRLTLCLLLLSGYMLLNTLLIHFRDDQYTAEFGLIDVSAVSLANGFLSTLAVLPVGALLSLLFRFSQVPTDQDATAAQTQTRRVSDVYSVEAHRDALLAENSVFESYLSWHNLQQWAQEAWRKKYERGLVEGHSPSLVSVLYGGPNNKNPGQCGSDFSSSGFEDCSLQDGKLQAKDFKHSHSDLQSSFSSEQGCVFEKQASGGSKVVLPSWCRYVAWTLCLSLSVTCIVLSAILGVKFSNTKSLLWIQSFFFSLFFCIFVVQPFMIFIAAAVVSMLFKGSCDFYKGTTETGPAFEVKHLNSKGVSLTTNYLHSPFHHPQDGHTHFDRILAARQRARYLRLARPPTSAQLRQVRDRVRKETLKQKTLRELVLYITMLFLLLFVTYGKFSSNHYHLNQAVRKEFTRSPNNPFSGVKTYEDWWNWSLTTLLDGLYWDTWYNRASAESKAGAVHGTCILIGEPTLKKIHVTNRTVCKIHSLFADLVPDCLPTYSPVDRGPGQSEGTASLALGDGPQHCGRIACYTGQGTRVNLGRARSSASVKLQELKASGWLDRDTRAVMVEFTLYNPPSNLFTSVSLLAEMPITGGLLPSVSIESVRVYHILCVLDYCIMGFELLFLAFILVQNYFQVYAMTQKGLLMYWQDPCNWLEVSIIVISLLYYIYYLYGFILTVEVIDRLQRDNFKAFVDLSFLSSWEQLTRCLHGVIVFLLLVKCIFVLRMNKVMAPSVTGLRLSLSTIMWPVVAGIIFMTAYACLGNLVFLSTSRSFSTIVRSFQTVFTHCMGASKLQTLSSLNRIHHASISVYYGTLFVIMTITWTALIIGILTSLARAAKKSSKRKYLVTFSDVMAYIRDRALVFIGRKRHRWIDNSIQRSYFYLDEFENLVDELLFRLNAFSNSLHHTLPNKEQNYHEQESLLTSQSDYDCSLDSEHTAVSEDCVKKKASKIEMLLLKKNPDVYNLILPIEEKSPDQNVLSSKLELETLRHFQMNLNCSPQIAGLEDGHFQPTAQLQKDLSKVNAGVKAIDADSADPSCSSVSDCHSSPIIPDHYNLAKLGDDLPHILCGTRCLDKQVAQGKTLGSQVSNRQSSTSASLSTKSRKVLKRSHTTIIQPWDNPTEVADRRAGNKIYSETKIPANPSLKSRTKDKGPKGPNGDMMGMKKQKQKSKHYVMIAMDNADSEVKGDFPGSPGAVRQCW